MEKETLRLIFGLKVHLLRQQKGLTLQQLADKTGTAVSHLHGIEKGMKQASPDKIMALATALDTTYDTLVSVNGMKQIQPIVDLLSSDFLKNYPLEVFGLAPDKIIDLMSSTPSKMSAFISAMLKIARSYDLNRESLYMVALRSYQDMHDNYFPELEAAAQDFRTQYADAFALDKAGSSAPLAGALQKAFGIHTERGTLAAQPQLKHIRSYFAAEKKVLYLNDGLSPAQERFLMAREIGFQVLNIHENRPYETMIQQAENFEKLLHNQQASYVASALLMSPDTLADDIRRCGACLDWTPNDWLALLPRYNVSPEMLLQRFTNILPGLFGIKDLFFIRLQRKNTEQERFDMTKELHLSGQQSPYANERDQHYCRRWVSIEIIRRLMEAKSPNVLAMAQISEYYQSENRYVVLSMSNPYAASSASSSVSLGLRLTDDTQRLLRFTGDPTLLRRTVNTTCETCAMPDCESRAVAPVVIEKQHKLAETMAALQKLGVRS